MRKNQVKILLTVHIEEVSILGRFFFGHFVHFGTDLLKKSEQFIRI